MFSKLQYQYVEDHQKSPISKIQSNLILILKVFYKRKLINRPQCEILLQKIKNLQEVQNNEDVLKQATCPEGKQAKSKRKEEGQEATELDGNFNRRLCMRPLLQHEVCYPRRPALETYTMQVQMKVK
ncbi:Hypothetical_protein [Hexamita inflata]|uniref:Hypothetical_protein n=1 Tax=Hexamita inflata TaxID=28002 RepID=A0ABP1KGY5_9EUKA